jgi:hypothetical protein
MQQPLEIRHGRFFQQPFKRGLDIAHGGAALAEQVSEDFLTCLHSGPNVASKHSSCAAQS